LLGVQALQAQILGLFQIEAQHIASVIRHDDILIPVEMIKRRPPTKKPTSPSAPPPHALSLPVSVVVRPAVFG
jgi:hypothetical protein